MSDAPRPEDHIRTYSLPSDLKITDLRTATVGWQGWRFTLIRIDTSQGLSGYGEVRDGASKTYALMLKSRLLGENPCDVDRLFRKIKQFGHHARQGGESGVSVLARALPVIREIVVTRAGQNVVVVSHKATIRLLLCGLLGVDARGYRDRFDQSPACLNVLDFKDPVRARLTLFNASASQLIPLRSHSD